MRGRITDSPRSGRLAVALLGLACCRANVESLGTTGLMAIPPVTLGGTVAPCDVGGAHRNACCHAGADANVECAIYPRSPFHACDPGWTTHPVPGTCCDTADPARCSAPPAFPPGSPPGSCLSACPPGFLPAGPITTASGTCCQIGPSSGECFSWADGPDAAPSDGTDSGDASTTCDVPCPPGWQKSPDAPDVCVEGSESFSQSPDPGAGAGGVIAVDASTPDETFLPNPAGSAGGGFGDGSYCSLGGAEVAGHTYSLACSNVTEACSCTEDSTTTTIAGVIVCEANGNDAIVAFWLQACGFPP